MREALSVGEEIRGTAQEDRQGLEGRPMLSGKTKRTVQVVLNSKTLHM